MTRLGDHSKVQTALVLLAQIRNEDRRVFLRLFGFNIIIVILMLNHDAKEKSAASAAQAQAMADELAASLEDEPDADESRENMKKDWKQPCKRDKNRNGDKKIRCKADKSREDDTGHTSAVREVPFHPTQRDRTWRGSGEAHWRFPIPKKPTE